jgi:WD40 repeat protein
VIRSPFAEMRGVLGKFSLASLPDATFLETNSGTAQLTRKSDGHSIQVSRGKSVMIRANNVPLEPRTAAGRTTRPARTMAIGTPVNAIFFEPEGLSLLTSGGNSVKRWEVSSGKFVGTVFSQPKKNIRHFCASLDGRLLALSNEERAARLIDAFSGSERQNLRRPMRLAAIAVSPDGATLAISWSAGRDHELRLYDTGLGLERVLHTGHAGPISALASSPRGTFLATAGADRSVRVWTVSDLQPAREFMRLPSEARCLAFSPDERTLAIGERKGDIRLFDLTTGSVRHVLAGHLRQVNSLAFAPDGMLLASASGDGTARLWHAGQGRELTAFKAHAGSVNSIGFSQDGRTVATGGVDRKLMLWDALSRQAE